MMKRRNFVKTTATGSAFLLTSGAFAFKNMVAAGTGGSATPQQVSDGQHKSSGEFKEMPGAIVKPAPDLVFPFEVDSNSPGHWDSGLLYVFMSPRGGSRKRASGPDLFNLSNAIDITIDNADKFRREGARWIEATHKDESGTLYGWYHNEPKYYCPQLKLKRPHMTVPRIGALVSTDNGKTWTDLGFILLAPKDSENCSTPNKYFAGGNGDFSVLPDAKKEYLYFFFGNYWGPLEQQGVAVARMKYSDRDAPAGKVFKWHQGGWKEPGKGGRVTAIFPALSSWHDPKSDVFWGPSKPEEQSEILY